MHASAHACTCVRVNMSVPSRNGCTPPPDIVDVRHNQLFPKQFATAEHPF